MRIILFPSLALVAVMITGTTLVYAQDPFTFGNSNDPFIFTGGVGELSKSNIHNVTSGGEAVLSNGTIHYFLPEGDIILQILSNTDWSGTYGDSTGSTTIDGHGNRDITLSSCSNTYSAFFQKKGQGQGFLTLNIISNETNPAFTSAMNNSTALSLSQNPNVNASVNYAAKVSKQFPEDIPQITNARTTTAQFGTVSVSGSC
jgi:hypothetical protein